ncbi:lactate utilization protein C [Alkalihalobacillus alcalophilus ATCC 27647 = CGMCC 1.3604]|uniref:Lactate utilization protein C n=1 Tax=Alkalihalobacillus alcalophilus ATCC 27647 = CGMCC 1.3604 TaxID=1218173 RepID=A0A094WME0_ALKAL|nr:lactate utilization protein C [Alkalihalobacillus alcalophilus]KGA98031.1 lactate utilization protein C [Alkalihalobacillus alcalophilus ATCC 27647 = CGMCC 1.3604]MED1561845.1 lactate utilization protein C [Alkalihalobacillus alcalophilus]THG88494.1 lactate utilization protein C [Alkalihalobacillus alcalophilus ATCC 27647 = CGMCC 1.3604]
MSRGTVHNQDKFLDKIASSLGRERKREGVVRPQWKKEPQRTVFADETPDQLVERLKEQCTRIHTTFERVMLDGLSKKLAEVMERYDGKEIIYWKDERFERFGVKKAFEDYPVDGAEFYEWDKDKGDENITLAERADIGITFSDITLAESGTVVLLSNDGKGRSVSLLPTSYIAIIPKSTIVPRMTQATDMLHELAQKEGEFPRCVNFISGPSNSADIEMNLVVGVHGPIRATYIIVDDM